MSTALQANAVFTYGLGELNVDGTVTLHLTCGQPGPGLPGDFTVPLSTANVSTISGAGTQAQKKAALDSIVQAYIIAQYRIPAATLAIQSALTALVGLTVTVA
jgi:hypothetical protein